MLFYNIDEWNDIDVLGLNLRIYLDRSDFSVRIPHKPITHLINYFSDIEKIKYDFQLLELYTGMNFIQ